MDNFFLFMGCSEFQTPIIEIAKESGLKLICVDKNGVCELEEKIDFVIQHDLTNHSKIAEKLKQLPLKEIIGYYGVADYAYESLFKIFDKMKIDDSQLSLSRKLTDKLKTNKILEKNKIMFPKTIELGNKKNFSFEKNINFPCIIKKSISYNSLDVVEVPDHQALNIFLKTKRSEDKLLLQEKIKGEVFNIDLIFMKDYVIKHAFTKRFFSKDFSATYSIEFKNNHRFKKHFDYAVDVCKKIGIKEGPVTLDFIESNGKIYLLEISQHLHSIYLNKISGKIENVKYWFLSFNKNIQDKKNIIKVNCHAAYVNIYLYSLKSLKSNMNTITSLDSYVEFKKRNKINITSDKRSLIGILFLKNKSLIALKRDINQINNLTVN